MAPTRHALLAAALLGVGAGCAPRTDVEQVPIGTKVEVTREDGGVVRGTLTGRDEQNLRVAVGPAGRSIARDDITSLQVVEGATAPVLPAAARFREFTLPEGTVLSVRLDSSLGSDTSHVEDAVEATLAKAVVVDGVELLPVGSHIAGLVTEANPAGKVRGVASLAVRFRSVADAGRTYSLSAGVRRTASSTRGDDAKKIGIPAAGGAVIGAIVGGKKGAAIGTAIGGGAGTAVVLATTGDEVHLPRGTVLSITLDRETDVRVPIVR
jgi:hypothetical protein